MSAHQTLYDLMRPYREGLSKQPPGLVNLDSDLDNAQTMVRHNVELLRALKKSRCIPNVFMGRVNRAIGESRKAVVDA